MLLRKQVGATPRGLQAQVLRAMLLVFGSLTPQTADRRDCGNLLGKIPMQTSFTRRRPESIPVKFRYFHHGLLEALRQYLGLDRISVLGHPTEDRRRLRLRPFAIRTGSPI